MRILYHIPYPAGIGDDRTIYDGYTYAFRGLGHDVVSLTERDNLGEKLRNVTPDFFITSLNIIDPARNAETLKTYRVRGGAVFIKAGVIEEGDHELIRLIRDDYLADVYTTELEWPQFQALTGRALRMLPLAASRQYHFPVPPVKKYECDILYVGANLPKKRELYRRRLFPLKNKYHVKIFGMGWDAFDTHILRPLGKAERKLFGTGLVSDWRIGRQVPYEEENQAYASAKISLNFHEEMGDRKTFLLNGRTFKIPACSGFEISDYVPLARKYFSEDELVMAKDDRDFFEKVEYYLTHEKERKEIQKRGTERALREHTYHNRARTILKWYSDLKRS
ncbi:MAG: glycosyltransferase [Candidatus Liptonbacteria bacterium]|nr:glycosyltransferase [Candidatus Liptonbacteria bacterium]